MGEPEDQQQARLAWEAQQRQLRRMQNVGLVILALGVLLLAYIVLTV